MLTVEVCHGEIMFYNKSLIIFPEQDYISQS
jgi:hypothetical protein